MASTRPRSPEADARERRRSRTCGLRSRAPTPPSPPLPGRQRGAASRCTPSTAARTVHAPTRRRKLGELALRALDEYAPDAADASPRRSGSTRRRRWPTRIYERVGEKLRREPVEDFRIDFEDGYGNRPDAEEDGHAAAAAERGGAPGLAAGTLPPFIGIRIKPFTEELRERSVRTLDIFLTDAASSATGGTLPPNFVVTLPKVTVARAGHARSRDAARARSSARLGLAAGALRSR